jgi:hypothetical protein
MWVLTEPMKLHEKGQYRQTKTPVAYLTGVLLVVVASVKGHAYCRNLSKEINRALDKTE